MEFLSSIVDIDSISVKNLPFTPGDKGTEIEALANSIVELGGLASLPVVEQVSFGNYELISGYLEYFAYRQACKLNPRLPDRISVFIATRENQLVVKQQIQILELLESSRHSTHQLSSRQQSEEDLKVRNLEVLIKNNNQSFVAALENVRDHLLTVIEENSPKLIAPLDLFNRILETRVAFHIQSKLEAVLNASETRTFISRLQEHTQHSDQQPFQTFAEVMNFLKVKRGNALVRIVAADRMLKIIDSFQSENFSQLETNSQNASFISVASDNSALAVAMEQLEPVVVELRSKLPWFIPPLEAFNRATEPAVSTFLHRKLLFLGDNKAQKLVVRLQEINRRKEPKAFESFTQVLTSLKMQQDGEPIKLSAEKMIEVIDRWNAQ